MGVIKMKKITLVLISLFVFIIGISCASTADLNSNSIADDHVAMAEIGNGNVVAHVASIDSDRPELAREEATKREVTRPESERSVLSSNGPNIWLPALGTGMGGGPKENYY